MVKNIFDAARKRVITSIKHQREFEKNSQMQVFLEYFAAFLPRPFVFISRIGLGFFCFFSFHRCPSVFSRLLCINCDSAVIQPLQPFDAAAIIVVSPRRKQKLDPGCCQIGKNQTVAVSLPGHLLVALPLLPPSLVHICCLTYMLEQLYGSAASLETRLVLGCRAISTRST